MAEKNKKEKDYSNYYEKKVSINPMTDAFSMDEDKPSIAGAMAKGIKESSKDIATGITKEIPNEGRMYTLAQKVARSPKEIVAPTGIGISGGAGYVAGRYDEKDSKKMVTDKEIYNDQMSNNPRYVSAQPKMSDTDMESLERSISGISPSGYKKGGVSKMKEIESGGKKTATQDYEYGHDNKMFDKLGIETDYEEVFKKAKGGMSVEEYEHAQKNPHSRNSYKDGGDIHVTKGHDYIKDLIKWKADQNQVK